MVTVAKKRVASDVGAAIAEVSCAVGAVDVLVRASEFQVIALGATGSGS